MTALRLQDLYKYLTEMARRDVKIDVKEIEFGPIGKFLVCGTRVELGGGKETIDLSIAAEDRFNLSLKVKSPERVDYSQIHPDYDQRYRLNSELDPNIDFYLNVFETAAKLRKWAAIDSSVNIFEISNDLYRYLYYQIREQQRGI